ncbi:UNVERIFIED_CONTAM: hypothetical protein HDU68_000507, partial [Siphonaria sp. JEL0065]
TLVLLSFALTATAFSSVRCGRDFDDANNNCGPSCSTTIACPNGFTCYPGLKVDVCDPRNDPGRPHQGGQDDWHLFGVSSRCGSTWDDANGNCRKTRKCVGSMVVIVEEIAILHGVVGMIGEMQMIHATKNAVDMMTKVVRENRAVLGRLMRETVGEETTTMAGAVVTLAKRLASATGQD